MLENTLLRRLWNTNQHTRFHLVPQISLLVYLNWELLRLPRRHEM